MLGKKALDSQHSSQQVIELMYREMICYSFGKKIKIQKWQFYTWKLLAILDASLGLHVECLIKNQFYALKAREVLQDKKPSKQKVECI